MAKQSLCKIEGCCNKIVARGWCGKHYQQWRKTAPEDQVKKKAKAGEPLEWIRTHLHYEGDDCLIWPFARYGSGYAMINRPDGNAGMASRFLCEMLHGSPPDGDIHAAHTCGNGKNACMNPRHLYWASRTENEADKIKHGTSNRGEQNGQSRITAVEVLAIRSSDESTSALAKRYDVSAPTICDIKSRRSWKWLK